MPLAHTWIETLPRAAYVICKRSLSKIVFNQIGRSLNLHEMKSDVKYFNYLRDLFERIVHKYFRFDLKLKQCWSRDMYIIFLYKIW